MKIAVLDDEAIERENIIKCIEAADIGMSITVEGYDTAEDLLNSSVMYNIAFIDIELNGDKSGLEVAEEYSYKNPDCLNIIVTTHEELSCEGYKYNVFRFIFKRRLIEDIGEALRSAIVENENNKEVEFLVVNNDKMLVKLKNILYLENEARNVRLHLKSDSCIVKGSVNIFKEKLEKVGFICPHKSFLVNSLWVERIKNNDIILKNGEIVPVTIGKRAGIKRKIAENKVKRN